MTKKPSKTVTCAWCAQTYPLTPGGRPKQHRNGAAICVGSGQPKIVHDERRRANAEAFASRGKPK